MTVKIICIMHICTPTLICTRSVCTVFNMILSDRLIDTSVADADAVLILENTKLLNYVNADRHNGFDSHTTFLILSVISTL